LITPSESKFIGWTGQQINEYPTLAEIVHAPRVSLVRWYRFLRSPVDDDERKLLEKVIEALKASSPVHNPEFIE
jgi:hypothetical protein